jgi:hypothetical protein
MHLGAARGVYWRKLLKQANNGNNQAKNMIVRRASR